MESKERDKELQEARDWFGPQFEGGNKTYRMAVILMAHLTAAESLSSSQVEILDAVLPEVCPLQARRAI